jgi:hypothetical protein
VEPFEPSFPLYIGRCIYCGATGNLSDEHVIPFGLAGEWVLRHASCATHRDVTSRFERTVLRGPINIPRTIMGIRTRRKKERPRSLSLTVLVDGQEKELSFDPADHPGFFAMPVFQPPGRLEGVAVQGIRKPVDFVVPYRKARYPNPGASLGAAAARVPFPDLIALARLLAKIGYGFAVACLGLEAVGANGCLPSILGVSEDIGEWVGCISDPKLTTEEGVHQAVLRQHDGLWVCHLRLLAGLQLPEYVVVVSDVAPC